MDDAKIRTTNKGENFEIVLTQTITRDNWKKERNRGAEHCFFPEHQSRKTDQRLESLGRVILLEWRNESGRKLTLACNPMDALWEKFLALPFHLSFRQDVFEWKSFRFRETELLRRRNEILTFIETDNIVLYSNHYPLDYLKKKKKVIIITFE